MPSNSIDSNVGLAILLVAQFVIFLVHVCFFVTACAVAKYLNRRREDVDPSPEPGFLVAAGVCLIMLGATFGLGLVFGNPIKSDRTFDAFTKTLPLRIAWFFAVTLINALILMALIRTSLLRAYVIVFIQWLCWAVLIFVVVFCLGLLARITGPAAPDKGMRGRPIKSEFNTELFCSHPMPR